MLVPAVAGALVLWSGVAKLKESSEALLKEYGRRLTGARLGGSTGHGQDDPKKKKGKK